MNPEQIPHQDPSRFGGAKRRASESFTAIKNRTIEAAHTAKETAEHLLQHTTEYAQVTGIAMGSIFAPTDMMNAHQAALDAMSMGNAANSGHVEFVQIDTCYPDNLLAADLEKIEEFKDGYQKNVYTPAEMKPWISEDAEAKCPNGINNVTNWLLTSAPPEAPNQPVANPEAAPEESQQTQQPQATATSEYKVLDPNDPNVTTIPPLPGSEFEEDYYNNLNNPPATNDENVSDMRKRVDSFLAFLNHFHPDNIGTSLVASSTVFGAIGLSTVVYAFVSKKNWNKAISTYIPKQSQGTTNSTDVLHYTSVESQKSSNKSTKKSGNDIPYITIGETTYDDNYFRVDSDTRNEQHTFDEEVYTEKGDGYSQTRTSDPNSFVHQASDHLANITGTRVTGGRAVYSFNPLSRNYVEFDFDGSHGVCAEDLYPYIDYDVEVTDSSTVRIYPEDLH